jgi:hypothetical protein
MVERLTRRDFLRWSALTAATGGATKWGWDLRDDPNPTRPVSNMRGVAAFIGPMFLLGFAVNAYKCFMEDRTPPSALEIQHNRKEVFEKFPLNNQAIWYAVLLQTGQISEQTIDKIIGAYKEYKHAFPADNPPAAAHLERAGFTGLRRNRFLNKVAFNYDPNLTARERHQKALNDLQAGRRKSVIHNDEEYWTVEDQIEKEMGDLLSFRILDKYKWFNHKLQEEETIYRASTAPDRAILYQILLSEYQSQVVPYLEVGEVIKPSPLNNCSYSFHNPAVPSIARIS